MGKIIFLDVDGTLVDYETCTTVALLAKLRRVQK